MNPFVLSLITMLLRYGVMAVAGALGLTHLVQPLIDRYLSDYEQVTAAIALALATALYAAARKFWDKQKFATAAAADYKISERDVEFKIQMGRAASVVIPKSEVPL